MILQAQAAADPRRDFPINVDPRAQVPRQPTGQRDRTRESQFIGTNLGIESQDVSMGQAQSYPQQGFTVGVARVLPGTGPGLGTVTTQGPSGVRQEEQKT